jgi:hypothetical protein
VAENGRFIERFSHNPVCDMNSLRVTNPSGPLGRDYCVARPRDATIACGPSPHPTLAFTEEGPLTGDDRDVARLSLTGSLRSYKNTSAADPTRLGRRDFVAKLSRRKPMVSR